jgi:NAD(P)-dependent dehydrogenase (short-subunit alcohol dehydrogenase family)
MVSLTEVRSSNTSLPHPPRTAFFAGATSGIGKATLAALVALKTPIKIYVAGRRETAPKLQPFFEELRRANSSAEIIWLDAELSLLSDAKRVAEVVMKKEERLDVMCLSQGYAPFGGRKGIYGPNSPRVIGDLLI